MKERRLSDQYYDWSDIRPLKSPDASPAAETQAAGGPTASPGGVLARFIDRALQALRKSGMQMRHGTGAWSEVLPVGQPVGIETTDGLRALRVSATGPAVRGELSTRSRNPQGNLRHQSRTVATTATTVDRIGDCHRHSPAGGHRPTGCGCRSGRQHAPGVFLASTAQAVGGGTAR
jgi:hypothetical protein